MQSAVPLACFLSMIRPPGVQYENALLQIAPVDKSKCPFIKDSNDIGFQLFTRHNPTVFQELVMDDDEKLFASNIDFNDKTVLYFHAWMEQPDDGSGIMIREAYMQRGDTNVIMVDAHHLEAGPWYFTAAQNTWYIGRFAAQFIDYLVSRGLNLNNTHLVGHSLGAQAAGVAGSALKSGRVARITGLDPALPLFDHLPLEQRLDPTDAQFVDIIHTDAGIFGYKTPMGDADFYPNGGISPQPGCELEVVIPKQLLLNKCDKNTQTRGIYIYHLTANQDTTTKHSKMQHNLEKLYNYIQSVKSKVGGSGTRTEDSTTYIKKLHDSAISDSNITVKNDNIKDNGNKGALEDYEDQIAEASETEITALGFNEHTTASVSSNDDELKDINTPTRQDKNIEKDTYVKINTETNTDDQTVVSSNNNEIISKSDTTRFTLFDLEDYVTETVSETPKYEEAVEDTTSEIYYYDYKKPCKPKKAANEINKGDTKFENDKLVPLPIDENKRKSQANNINILNVLGRTYKAFQIVSTIKDIKNKFLTKSQIFKPLTETTPTIDLKNHVVKRQKRFLPFLKRSEDENILFKMLDFLIKNRKNVLPVFTVMREINTLVKSGNGELNHVSRESNNYIGATPPTFKPITYTLELGNENKVIAFVKKLLGVSPKGDRLTVHSK